MLNTIRHARVLISELNAHSNRVNSRIFALPNSIVILLYKTHSLCRSVKFSTDFHDFPRVRSMPGTLSHAGSRDVISAKYLPGEYWQSEGNGRTKEMLARPLMRSGVLKVLFRSPVVSLQSTVYSWAEASCFTFLCLMTRGKEDSAGEQMIMIITRTYAHAQCCRTL